MKRISVLLIVVLLLSALVLPGLAYAKKPAGTPGKGPLGLGITGKPSTVPPVRSTEENKGKKQGWKSFVLEGTIDGDPSGQTFRLKIKAGTVKRVTGLRLKAARAAGTVVEIKVLDSTIFWSKSEKFKADFGDLTKDARVHVKGKIVADHTPKLEATRVFIKPAPKPDDD